MSDEKIIAYKGFNKDMTCLGFQYEEGKTYECDEAILCKKGFHACIKPLEVLDYYPPSNSVYHVVELEGVCSEQNGDSKVCARKITIGREISIRELSELAIEYAKTHCKGWNESRSGQFKFFDEYGIVTANREGNHGVATAGDCGVATSGDCGVATAGNCGAATAGYRGAATAGDHGAATAGNCGAATAGYHGAATAGDCGTAISRGSVSIGTNGLGCVRGTNVKIKGGLGAILVIAVEEDDTLEIKEWKTIVVDGQSVKENTWYTLENGNIVEVENTDNTKLTEKIEVNEERL